MIETLRGWTRLLLLLAGATLAVSCGDAPAERVGTPPPAAGRVATDQPPAPSLDLLSSLWLKQGDEGTGAPRLGPLGVALSHAALGDSVRLAEFLGVAQGTPRPLPLELIGPGGVAIPCVVGTPESPPAEWIEVQLLDGALDRLTLHTASGTESWRMIRGADGKPYRAPSPEERIASTQSEHGVPVTYLNPTAGLPPVAEYLYGYGLALLAVPAGTVAAPHMVRDTLGLRIPATTLQAIQDALGPVETFTLPDSSFLLRFEYEEQEWLVHAALMAQVPAPVPGEGRLLPLATARTEDPDAIHGVGPVVKFYSEGLPSRADGAREFLDRRDQWQLVAADLDQL